MASDLDTLVDVLDDSPWVYYEGRPLGEVDAGHEDSKLGCATAIRIGEQGEVQFLCLCELGLCGNIVGTDSKDVDSSVGKLGRYVPQRTDLDASARGCCLGIEGQYGPAIPVIEQLGGVARLIVQAQRGRL